MINSGSNSLGDEVVDETMNLCLMAKGDSDLDENEISDPTYDDLLHIYNELHASYKCMKRKYSYLRKEFAHLELTHSMTLIKLENYKKYLNELKIKKSRIEYEFFKILDYLIYVTKILKKITY